ncbi:hypothetical protein HYW11_00135 [Candidatus Peregrinibacteria bacterium]|nr:hypothetical protein [Candidatus Peregrinibacteria bacterium]
MEQHHSMEILMSPEHCCSSELVVYIENAHLVIHLPPAFEGRIVRIEGSDARGAVGPDGHVNLPFVESAGTATLTMTNHEGDNIPFLRVTHDGHGTITNKHCLMDLQKLLEEEEHEHPHAAHEEHFHPHAPHEEHAEHPHSPHSPHMGAA